MKWTDFLEMEKRLSNDTVYKGNNCTVSIDIFFPSDNVEYVFCNIIFGRNECKNSNENRIRNFAIHYISSIVLGDIYIYISWKSNLLYRT